MRRLAPMVALGLIAAAGLAGCADRQEQYCSALRDDRGALSGTTRGSAAPSPAERLAVFQDLRDKAPEDLTDEWDTFVFAWQGLVDSLRKAGVDAASYDPDHPPAGVGAVDQRLISQAAADLASAKVRAAAEGIQRQASDVCKVDLGG